MTQNDTPQLRICPHSLAADAYETDPPAITFSDTVDAPEGPDARDHGAAKRVVDEPTRLRRAA